MTRAIDYDRGVMIKKDEKSGIEVYMYKDDPGVFLSVLGRPVSDDLAKIVYGERIVAEMTKRRTIRLKMKEAEAKIRAELETAEEGSHIVLERGEFKVLDIGLGRHRVLGPDNVALTSEVLSLEQATLLVDQLSPEVTAS